MLFRLLRRYSITSTKFFLVLTGASAIFVYLVSPLRDPAFQPRGANGGSEVWWLQGVHEDDWKLAAFIFAGLLAINFALKFTLDIWERYGSQTDLTASVPRRILSMLLIGMIYLGIVMVIWRILYYVSLLYLILQYLVD
jgi:hypothetical protein